MKAPLVTIGALNYNNSKYVIATLESIASQTYPNIELIVVDDCSTDDSLEKIKLWLSKYTKPYKLIQHNVNKGIHSAYESVIANSSGEYISLLATDDLITSDKIADQVEAFRRLDKTYGLVYSDIIDIDASGSEIGVSYFKKKEEENPEWRLPIGNVFKELVKNFLFFVQSSLFRAEYLKRFRFNLKAISEDYQVLLFITRYSKVYGINKIHTKYRRHGESLSTQVRKNNKHIWHLSHVYMFYEVYCFSNNDIEDKKEIENRIEFDLVNYYVHPKSSYLEAIKAWSRVKKGMPTIKAIKIFVSLHIFKLRSIISFSKESHLSSTS